MAKEKTNQEKLDALLADLRKKYGPLVGAAASLVPEVGRLSTGAPALDSILSGGWPKGRIIEVWGPRSVGKSLLCLYGAKAAIEANPKVDKPVVWFDQENTFEKTWAAKLGVNLDQVLFAPAMAGEDAGDLLLHYIRMNKPLIIIDSVIEMIPEKELVRGTGEESYSPVARLLSRLLPKIVVMQGRSPSILLVTNQVRDRVGFFFGETERASGGRALEHYDSVKVKMKRMGFFKKGDQKVGYELALKLIKSKVGNEQAECRLWVSFERGFVPDPGVKSEPEKEADGGGTEEKPTG